MGRKLVLGKISTDDDDEAEPGQHAVPRRSGFSNLREGTDMDNRTPDPELLAAQPMAPKIEAAKLRPVAVDEATETDTTKLHRKAATALRTDAGAARLFANLVGDNVRYDHARRSSGTGTAGSPMTTRVSTGSQSTSPSSSAMRRRTTPSGTGTRIRTRHARRCSAGHSTWRSDRATRRCSPSPAR
jgi:hypothetical protein